MFDDFIYRFTRYEWQTVEIVGVMTVDAEGMPTSSRGDARVHPNRYRHAYLNDYPRLIAQRRYPSSIIRIRNFDWHRVDPARYSVIRRGNAYYAIMPLDEHIFIFKLMVRGPDMELIGRNCL